MSLKALLTILIISMTCVMWLTAPGARAADGPITPGGDITVDGHPIQGKFLRQGNTMLFPIVELAKAAGKTADVSGTTASVGTLTAPVTLQDGVAYVDYRGVATLLPELHFGATATRAVFTTRATTASTPAPGHSGAPKGAADATVSILGEEASVDANRGRQLVIEAIFQNNTSQDLPPLKVTLQVIDINGAAGGEAGKARLYVAPMVQSLKLAANGAQKLTFETGVSDPQNVDSASQSCKVFVNGLEMSQTTVDLVWQFKIEKE